MEAIFVRLNNENAAMLVPLVYPLDLCKFFLVLVKTAWAMITTVQ